MPAFLYEFEWDPVKAKVNSLEREDARGGK